MQIASEKSRLSLQGLLYLTAPGTAGEKLGGQDGSKRVARSDTHKFPAADRLGRSGVWEYEMSVWGTGVLGK